MNGWEIISFVGIGVGITMLVICSYLFAKYHYDNQKEEEE